MLKKFVNNKLKLGKDSDIDILCDVSASHSIPGIGVLFPLPSPAMF